MEQGRFWVFIFLAVLGLHCCVLASPSCAKWGLLSSCGAQASHRSGFSSCRAQSRCPAFNSCGTCIQFSCLAACGILPDRGSHPCPPRWEVDSYPLNHQGSPGQFGGCLAAAGALKIRLPHSQQPRWRPQRSVAHDALGVKLSSN